MKRKAADVKEDDEADCIEDEIIASVEVMLQSLVERMVKCEPEDFELVHCSVTVSVLVFITS